MRFVLFYHSLLSDWNHGNAHFLRGVVTELQRAGHRVQVYEPQDGWSLTQLRAQHGERVLGEFQARYPLLRSTLYLPDALDLDAALAEADVVIVHEWNPPALVRRIGRHRAAGGRYRLLFHDTHHRAVSAAHELAAFDLSDYDGVLAFGEVLSMLYRERGWARRVWTWHEAADTNIYRPLPAAGELRFDLVWVGNWGDGERSAELREFLIEPVRRLGLRALVHGVRYPDEALAALRAAGIDYGGWAPNYRVPELFAAARCTVHVPRRFYRDQLPGIPTIRMFEALACRVPLVSAPWQDSEGLFEPGRDYLVASDGAAMRRSLQRLTCDRAFAEEIAAHGHHSVLARHTCAHRVRELLAICRELGACGDSTTAGQTARAVPA